MTIQTATNPQTGETVAFVDGAWKSVSQTATNKIGAKAYLVGNKWITDEPPQQQVEQQVSPQEQPGDRYSGAILKGVAGLAGLPGDALRLLETGIVKGGELIGLDKVGIQPKRSFKGVTAGKEDIIKAIEQATGVPLYKPETTGQRYFEKAVEGAVSMPGSAATMGMGALSGLGGEFGGNVAGVPGAVLGAALPLVAPAAAAKTIGGITDLVKGRTSDIRAGKVLRDAAGVKRAAIEAEMAGKGSDVTAAQAAVGAGSTRWSALGDRAAQQRSEYFKALEDAQELQRLETLRGVAGGGTQTEARQAQDIFKKGINAIRGPEREVALANANTAGRMLPKYVDMLNKKRESMVSALQDAGKGFAQEGAYRQGIRGLQEGSAPGWSQAKIGRLTDRVGEQRSYVDDLMTLRNQRKAEGDFIKMQADSLAEHGLKPLKPDAVVSKLDDMLKDPRIGPDDLASRALRNVRNKFAKWTNEHGVIDAEAVETIRKRAVNDVIEQKMGSADPKAKARRTAEIMGMIKDPIVKAIEDAGGTGYGAYLRNYASDMERLNRQKLGAELLATYKKSPDEFANIAKGENPNFVKEIMGNEYDVAKALGGRNDAVQKVAAEVERNNRLSDLAAAGKTDVANVLSQDASKWRLPMWLNRYVTAANKGLDIAESALNAKTMAKVYEAMENPNKALKVLNELPLTERNKVLKAMVELKNMPKSVRVGQEAAQQ